MSCLYCTVATPANESYSVSPGPKNSMIVEEEPGVLDRQSSYDKVQKKLRGAAKKSKVSKILKDRVSLGDDDELIDTNELKSSSEGVLIADTQVRSNKARNLKKRIQNAALELNRCCGYSVLISAQAPLPVKGPRGGGLVLNLVDKN